MPDSTCLNARADECSITTAEWGQRIVRYAGEEFVMIGLYVGCNGTGQAEIYYILRMPSNGNYSYNGTHRSS